MYEILKTDEEEGTGSSSVYGLSVLLNFALFALLAYVSPVALFAYVVVNNSIMTVVYAKNINKVPESLFDLVIILTKCVFMLTFGFVNNGVYFRDYYLKPRLDKNKR